MKDLEQVLADWREDAAVLRRAGHPTEARPCRRRLGLDCSRDQRYSCVNLFMPRLHVEVVIPVGPEHEALALEAAASVKRAWQVGQGPFVTMAVQLIDDRTGHGRSRARNRGLNDFPADWHFLMDADDRMCPSAFGAVDLGAVATFGAVCLGERIYRRNRYRVTRDALFKYGADGTLSMGCFVRGDLGLRFDETLDVGEDFDFYMRLPSFTKRREPLVNIGYDHPSAGGPRSSRGVNWLAACRAVIDKYQAVEAGAAAQLAREAELRIG